MADQMIEWLEELAVIAQKILQHEGTFPKVTRDTALRFVKGLPRDAQNAIDLYRQGLDLMRDQ